MLQVQNFTNYTLENDLKKFYKEQPMSPSSAGSRQASVNNLATTFQYVSKPYLVPSPTVP